jgi:hypothetical protein
VFAESTTDPPAQKEVLGDVILTVGVAFTVMFVAAEVDEQFVLLTATVYAPAVVTVYVTFVAPVIIPVALDHWYVKPEPVFAESTIDPPVQKEVLGDVMLAVGIVFTVMFVVVEVTEQFVLLTFTVYAPAVVAV